VQRTTKQRDKLGAEQGTDLPLLQMPLSPKTGLGPQHIKDSLRVGSFGWWRMTGTGWVGAML
jgi:hypothetical protein